MTRGVAHNSLSSAPGRTSKPPSPQLHTMVRDEQVRHFRQMLPVIGGTQMVIAALTALVVMGFYGSTPVTIVGIWLGLVWLAGVRCLLSWLRTRKRPPQTEVPLRLLRGFAVSGAVMGAIWGGGALFLFPPDVLYGQALLSFVVAGMTAGAAATLWNLPSVGLSFMAPAIIPLIVRLALVGGTVQLMMAVMVGVYLVAMSLVSGLGYRNFLTGIKAKMHLAVSERRLAEAQRIGKMGHFRTLLNPLQPEWSDEVYRLFGYDPGEIEASAEFAISIMHSDDRERYLEVRNTAIEQKQGFFIEYRVIQKDGKEIVVAVNSRAEFDDAGEIVALIGTIQDITERKHTEDIQRLQALVALQMSEGVIVTDVDGRLIDLNPAAEKMFGYSKEEILGHTTDILHDNTKFAGTYSQMIVEGIESKGYWREDVDIIRKDGSIADHIRR